MVLRRMHEYVCLFVVPIRRKDVFIYFEYKKGSEYREVVYFLVFVDQVGYVIIHAILSSSVPVMEV